MTDAPRYRHGLVIAAACAIAGSVVILKLKLLYRILDGGDGGVETKVGVSLEESNGPGV